MDETFTHLPTWQSMPDNCPDLFAIRNAIVLWIQMTVWGPPSKSKIVIFSKINIRDMLLPTSHFHTITSGAEVSDGPVSDTP
jgi:hypothetical protein